MVGKEEWKDVVGYEGLYQVSSQGNIRSCERYVNTSGGGKRKISSLILKKFKCPGGYLEVNLWKNNKQKTTMIHRLVAETFIPNPLNFPEVNHKDESKENNCLDNLEWCTSKYNANYGTRNKRMIKDYRLKPVVMCSKNGQELKSFKSLGDVVRETGFDISAIIRACKGKQKTSYGYVWKYAQNRGVL